MRIKQRIGSFAGALLAAALATGQATLPAIDVRTIAEVETPVVEDGRELVHLSPATRVVPGDRVIYSVEIRNTGATDVIAPTVTRPLPEHMAYVAGSASGPGAEITFSVDGGTSFDRPENLRTAGPDGKLHIAKSYDYTHIRWQFKIVLKSKSVAYARFRAVVK